MIPLRSLGTHVPIIHCIFFLIVNDGKTGTQMSDENCGYQNAERHSLIYSMNDELEERPNMMSQSENNLTIGENKGKNVNIV